MYQLHYYSFFLASNYSCSDFIFSTQIFKRVNRYEITSAPICKFKFGNAGSSRCNPSWQITRSSYVVLEKKRTPIVTNQLAFIKLKTAKRKNPK